MDLEVVLDGQVVECRKVGGEAQSAEGDERAVWAARLEGRARELSGFGRDRVVFHQNGDGLVLVADRERPARRRSWCPIIRS